MNTDEHIFSALQHILLWHLSLTTPAFVDSRTDDVNISSNSSTPSIPAMELQGDIMSAVIRNYLATSERFSREYTECEEKIKSEIDEWLSNVVFTAPKKAGGRAPLSQEEKQRRAEAREAKKKAAALKKAEKQAAREAKQKAAADKKAQKQAAREAKQKAAAEKAETCRKVRLNYPKGHPNRGTELKGTNGTYLRYWKNKITGEMTKFKPETWTPAANKLFDEITKSKVSAISAVSSASINETDPKSQTRALFEKKKQEIAAKKKLKEDQERLEQERLEQERQQKLMIEQAGYELDIETMPDDQTDNDANASEKSNEFTHELWPDTILYIKDGGIYTDEQCDNLVGFADNGNVEKIED